MKFSRLFYAYSTNMGRYLLLAIFIVAAGCINNPPEIKVHDVYFMSSGMSNAISIFMVIENHGGADNLISAKIKEFPNAKVELHTIAGGMMLKVDKIEIPKGETVPLKRGGYHIMAFGADPSEDEITLILEFEKFGSVEVKAQRS
jgi:copper(I)-binding protein